MSTQPPRLVAWRQFSLLIASLIAAMLLPSLVATARQGDVTGPSFTLRLGSYYLIARTTEHPACLPLPEQCFIPRPTFRIPQPRHYVIWAGQIVAPEVRGRRVGFATVSGRRLLELPVGPW